MLELCPPTTLSQQEWSEVPLRAELPPGDEDYFHRKGPLPVPPETRRRYQRHYLTSVAVIQEGSNKLAGYARDISRLGIGFYSPRQLFPGDVVQLFLPGKPAIWLEITRCRRRGTRCYECGSVFRTDTPKRSA